MIAGAPADSDAGAYDLAILSPGIDPATALVKNFRARGIPIVGELELAFVLCARPVIAITGTNGKTTTTQLIEKCCSAAALRPSRAATSAPHFPRKSARAARWM